MRDLLIDPCWSADDLGESLPMTDHAVSVALPLWEHAVGYEEGDPAVLGKFKAGYPRFCCHPYMTRLFEKVAAEEGSDEESCVVFATASSAQRCVAHLQGAGRVAAIDAHGTTGVLFPKELGREARLYWRFCGEIVSSRLAARLLGLASGTVNHQACDEAAGVIRRRIAQLAGEEADSVFLFPSGMAAVAAVQRLLSGRKPGARTVQCDFPYVDVLKVQEIFGTGAELLLFHGEQDYRKLAALADSEPIAGLYAELPSNPLLRSIDIQRVAEIARTHDIPVVVDDTVATAVNLDAATHADLITTSLTKSFSGSGDVMAGAVTIPARSPYHAEFRRFFEAEERGLWGEDAVVLEKNSRDFEERVHRSSATALRVAEHLADHPAVGEVFYPSMTTAKEYSLAARQGAGHGCLLSFVPRNPSVTSPRIYDALEFSKGPSLGTNFSLACPYTILAHYDELDWAESCGVDRHLIRLSIGLEEPEELLARLDRALSRV